MTDSNANNIPDPKPGIETNYEAHQQNPGPSKEAIVEEDKNGASKVLKWIIPGVIILLLIIWFFFKQ